MSEGREAETWRNKWQNKITFLVLTVQTKVVQTVSVLLFLRLVPDFVT